MAGSAVEMVEGKGEEVSGLIDGPLTPESFVVAIKAKSAGAELINKYGGIRKLCEALQSDPAKGLPDDERVIRDRQVEFGENYIQREKIEAYCSLCLEGMKDPIMIMLLASAILSLILGLGVEQDFQKGWIEGLAISITILLVVNVAASVDYTKAWAFEKQQRKLENSGHVTVIRGGKDKQVLPRELVVGDILRVTQGDKIPADGMVVEGNNLQVDESAMTGEPELFTKTPEVDEDWRMLSGTNIMFGEGKMLVVACGLNSFAGQIMMQVAGQAGTKDDEGEEGGGCFSCCGGCCGSDREPDDGGQVSDGSSSLLKAESTPHPDEVEPKKKCCDFMGQQKMAEAEGMADKLGIMAIEIGKLGAYVSTVTVLIMIIVWCIEEFGQNKTCGGVETLTSCNASKTCTINWRTNESLASGNGWAALSAAAPADTPYTCLRGWDWGEDLNKILQFLITGITIMVVAIPEGLPLAVTLSLFLSMMKMTKDNNQVKHLDATETMGTATTVCSDKTGTLTENKMTVMRAYFGGAFFEHDAATSTSVAAAINKGISDDFSGLLVQAMALNSAPKSKVKQLPAGDPKAGEFEYVGNATDCALLKLCHLLGVDPEEVRRDPAIKVSEELDWGNHVYPFSSQRKKMAWSIPLPGGGFRLFVKGAPAYVYKYASHILQADGRATKALDAQALRTLDETVKGYQGAAMRTLCLAYRDFKVEPDWGQQEGEGATAINLPETKLTVIGVVGIEDPLRSTVKKAIQDCAKAGVDVRMCTGDALATAVAISKQCGILRANHLEDDGSPKPDFAMTGAEFDERVHELDRSKPKIKRRHFDAATGEDGEAVAFPFRQVNGEKVLIQRAFDRIWPRLRVLARCQPEDKLTLVSGLRSSKVFRQKKHLEELADNDGIHIFPDYQVVAVTGDGTNDAPALKAANVGFAMGIVGTDVAKAACDIELIDDNFASIVKAILWGRNVFDSISKFIQFQLTVNIAAIMVAVVGAMAFTQSPLSAVQLLWVNLIMDTLASLGLATEPPDEILLDRPPYGRKRAIISPIMWTNMLGQAVYQLAVIFVVLFAGQGFLPCNVGHLQWQKAEPLCIADRAKHGADYAHYDNDACKPQCVGAWANASDPAEQPTDLSTKLRQYPQPGHLAGHGDITEHWTIIFNVFVLMTIFNQLNSRKLQTVERLKSTWQEWIVFIGLRNPVFVVIFFIELGVQVLVVQVPGMNQGFGCTGLSGEQWGYCLIFAAISLVWQFVINVFLVALDACGCCASKAVEDDEDADGPLSSPPVVVPAHGYTGVEADEKKGDESKDDKSAVVRFQEGVDVEIDGDTEEGDLTGDLAEDDHSDASSVRWGTLRRSVVKGRVSGAVLGPGVATKQITFKDIDDVVRPFRSGSKSLRHEMARHISATGRQVLDEMDGKSAREVALALKRERMKMFGGKSAPAGVGRAPDADAEV